MVDVTAKPWTRRRALARCRVDADEAALVPFTSGPPPGAAGLEPMWAELLGAARLAGIQAAKQTARLIPLCHSLTGSDVEVDIYLADGCIEVQGRAEVVGPTGIEMEALTVCAVARRLTLVRAILPADPNVSIEGLGLWEKSGGRSGTWVRR